MKLVLTSALFGALFLISGCGTQCESVCAQYNTCSIETERTVAVDCANFCGIVDGVNSRATAKGTTGCDAKWTEHLACWRGHTADICDTEFTDCDATGEAWETCISDYCGTLGADDYDPQCDSGDILVFTPFHSGY